jgi:hypothetical protein
VKSLTISDPPSAMKSSIQCIIRMCIPGSPLVPLWRATWINPGLCALKLLPTLVTHWSRPRQNDPSCVLP